MTKLRRRDPDHLLVALGALLALAAMLFFASCAPGLSRAPAPPYVVLSPDAETEKLVREAADQINFLADAQLVEIAPGGVEVSRCPDGICGWHTGDKICYAPCSKVADLSAAALVHEIGHAILGPKHSRWRGSIMAARLQQLDLEEASRSLVSALP